MGKFARITGRWFKARKTEANGLSASLQELMEQRKNLSRLYSKAKFSASDMAGEVKSAFKGRGIEMEEIREYAFGDDVRDIDWRVTARKKTPYTKVYAEEKDREIYVLLDLSPSMVFGTKKELKSVTASKVAALIGWLSQKNKDRFGTVIYDGKNTHIFKSQQNRAHLLAVLKKISEVGKSVLSTFKQEEYAREGMAYPLQVLSKLIKSRAAIFVLSDYRTFGESEKKSLSALSKKGELFCINIFDVLEKKAPRGGEYMVEKSGRTLVFDSHQKSFCKEYQKLFADKRENLRLICRNLGARYIEIQTDEDVFGQLKII